MKVKIRAPANQKMSSKYPNHFFFFTNFLFCVEFAYAFFPKRSPPSKRKSTNADVKTEILSPKQEKSTPKKTESPKKTPAKKSPAKKKSPKSNGKTKAATTAPKTSPFKTLFKAKTESSSPAKVKVEKNEKMETDQASEDTPKPSSSEQKVDKPKAHPFFTSKKDMKLESASDTAADGASYNPGKAKYDPIKDSFWKHGEK